MAVSKKTTTSAKAFNGLTVLANNKDTLFAVGICLILAMLFIPLPPLLLDVGLALSFASSVLVLMVALWIKKPLEFSAFPTLLLLVTVFRLALNVASSRLILAEGHTGTDAAGHVIQGIAGFAIGGDFIIGIIVFAILMVINFVVITKGSTRIAEVSARFSLDAMQGKQMAIDTDLASGIIDEDEARRRRKEVEGESGFFGAMDGASKFVRGDAVAGVIIIFVNIIAGVLIGILRQGMPIADALENYTVLTIGDGLVTQIPALVVSIAAAVIITKGSNEGTASDSVLGQLNGTPKAIYAAGGLMLVISLLPGFPFFLFATLALLMCGLGWFSQKTIAEDAKMAEAKSRLATPRADQDEKPIDMLKSDDLRLQLGSSLLMLINDKDAALPAKILSLRKLFATDFGFLLPRVRIKDDPRTPADGYSIMVHDVTAGTGKIVAGARLLIDPAGAASAFPGERVKEPTFGLDAIWVDNTNAAIAETQGFTVVDPESVVITHLTEVIKNRMADLMTYGMTLKLVESLDKDYQKLVNDLPGKTPVILLQHVLQKLLSERVSIRNLPLIVEALAEAGSVTTNKVIITEHVRRKLASQICDSLEDSSGFVPVITLGRSWATEFASNIKLQGEEHTCVMTPKRVQDFVLAARIEIQRFAAKEEWPAVMVSPEARPIIRSMLERVSPNTQVISHPEIHANAKLKTVSTIGD